MTMKEVEKHVLNLLSDQGDRSFNLRVSFWYFQDDCKDLDYAIYVCATGEQYKGSSWDEALAKMAGDLKARNK